MPITLTSIDEAWGSPFQGRSAGQAPEYASQQPNQDKVPPVQVAASNRSAEELLPSTRDLDRAGGYDSYNLNQAYCTRQTPANHPQAPQPLDETLRLLLVKQMLEDNRRWAHVSTEGPSSPGDGPGSVTPAQRRGPMHPADTDHGTQQKYQCLVTGLWATVAVAVILGLLSVGLGIGLGLQSQENLLHRQEVSRLREENQDLKIRSVLNSPSSSPIQSHNGTGMSTPSPDFWNTSTNWGDLAPES